MKKLFIYTIALLTLSACHTKVDKPVTDSVAVYHVPEEKAIKKAVDDTYNAISFKNGEQPHYDAMKNVFIPKAQFISLRSDSARVITLDQFIYLYRTMVESDSLQYVSEKELYGKTEQFGKVASRLSTYEASASGKNGRNEKGINLYQLVKTPAGWKVSSIIWDVEKKGLPVPGYYLGK